MQLTDIQVAGLRALASTARDDVRGLPPEVQAAFTMGQVVGQAKLARELLQEAQDRAGTINLDTMYSDV